MAHCVTKLEHLFFVTQSNMSVIRLLCAFIIYFHEPAFSVYEASDYKLELVQAIVRHGDRVARTQERYPNDPYDTFYKNFGYGRLTKLGKQRTYKVGQMLRQRYDSFLGDYNPEEIYAYSTDYERSKDSLQFVMAGLYPVTPNTSWSDDINWHPVSMQTEPENVSFLTTFMCSGFWEMVGEIANSPDLVKQFKQDEDFYVFIQNKTGLKQVRRSQIFLLHNNLHGIVNLGMKLPDWCTESVYKKIEEICRQALKLMTYNLPMTKLIVGPIVETLLNNIERSELPNNRLKIYVYSAQELAIGAFTVAHNITGNVRLDNPDYGNTLIVEKLRGPNRQVYLRMYEWDGVLEEMYPLKIPKCAMTCPLSEYKNVTHYMLPSEESRNCFKRGTLHPRPKSLSRKMTPSLENFLLLAKNDFKSLRSAQNVISRIH